MLKIFNDLKVFFEDNYTRVHVREFAKLTHITPPTASKVLEHYHTEGLLHKEIDKQHHLYYANKGSDLFKNLQNLYWKEKLEPLTNFIKEQTIAPVIILFGSAAKAELKKTSDIDIAVFTATTKNIDVTRFEKQLQRKIQLFTFTNFEKVSENLKKNILNGYKIAGLWS